jgi:ketose-bisphosphate aldolase
MISWFHDTAKNASVPVAIHLDHCKDLDLIRACIDAGWTSVMIDASAKPFEENLRLSKQVVEMAAPKNVSVEAELGKIGGVEDDISVADEDAHLVDPDEALRFCNELKLSCFAPAIGTAHGVYKGEPKISFDRLDRVANETGVPIALHGGTGLSVEVFKKSISHGAAKVNISTQLKHAFIDSFVEYYNAHRDEYNPLKNIQEQIDCVKKEVRENIVFFGSNGRV